VRRPRRIPGRISAKLIPHDARHDALECTGCTLVWLRRCHADFVPSTAAAAAGRARSHTCKRPLYLRSKREGSFPYRHPPSLPIPVPFASPPDSSTSPPSTARRAFPSFPQFFFSPRFPPPAPSLSLSRPRLPRRPPPFPPSHAPFFPGHVVIYSFDSAARGLPRIEYHVYLMARIQKRAARSREAAAGPGTGRRWGPGPRSSAT